MKSLSDCWPEYSTMQLPRLAETVGDLMDHSHSWDMQVEELRGTYQDLVERTLAALSLGFSVEHPRSTFDQVFAEATVNPMIRDFIIADVAAPQQVAPLPYFYFCVGRYLGRCSRGV